MVPWCLERCQKPLPFFVRNNPFTTYDSIAGMLVISIVPLIGIAFLAVFFMIY
jgi:hypothetical protein